jgi:hypothetical protein
MTLNEARVLISKRKFAELLCLRYKVNWTLKLFRLVKELRNEYVFTSHLSHIFRFSVPLADFIGKSEEVGFT